jgi:hypothetical protein
VGSSAESGGPSENVEASATTEVVTASEAASLDPIESWLKLAETENSLAQSELSDLEFGLFGLMVAPNLRLFKFSETGWLEVTDQFQEYFDIPLDELDYDITIQSVRITDDDAVDYVVNYRVAPWDVLKAGNQGRDHGTVLSGQGGLWRSVAFYDSFGDGLEYTAIEHIEFFSGALFGNWYGSCGRPCGLLIYEWMPGLNRLEGEEAGPAQKAAFESRLNCANFDFNESFPLGLCQEGTAIRLVQEVLVNLGYTIDADGYFGKGSEFALKIYQRANGIRATGRVAEATWKLMFESVGLPGNDLNGDGFVGPDELSGT